jgi:hypothetical protein
MASSLWGSNCSTAQEAMDELAVAEAHRAALIEVANPRTIPPKGLAVSVDERPQGERLEGRG